MAEDRVRVLGPIRDWVPEEVDEDGDVVGGFWQKIIFCEALGTDRNFHTMSFRFGDDVLDELVPQFIAFGKTALEETMKENGIW